MFNQKSTSTVSFMVLLKTPSFQTPSNDLVLEKIEKISSILRNTDDEKAKYTQTERKAFDKLLKEWESADVKNVLFHNPTEEIDEMDLEGLHMRLVLDTIPLALVEDGDFWLIGPADQEELESIVESML